MLAVAALALLGGLAGGCQHGAEQEAAVTALQREICGLPVQSGEKPLNGLSGQFEFASHASFVNIDAGSGTVQVKLEQSGVRPQVSWKIRAAEVGGAALPDTLKVYYVQDAAGKIALHTAFEGDVTTQPTVDLVVTVPKGTPVQARLGRGRLILGSDNALTARLGSGTLELHGSFTASQCQVTSGDVEAELLLTEGHHEWSIDQGKVKLTLQPTSSVDYEFGTSRGRIRLEGLTGLSQRNVQGETATGEVGPAEAMLVIHVGNGRIEASGPVNPGPVVGE
jgi:hypothetical protein